MGYQFDELEKELAKENRSYKKLWSPDRPKDKTEVTYIAWCLGIKGLKSSPGVSVGLHYGFRKYGYHCTENVLFTPGNWKTSAVEDCPACVHTDKAKEWVATHTYDTPANKKAYQKAKPFYLQTRYYVPIMLQGEKEHRCWSCSHTVFMNLVKLLKKNGDNLVFEITKSRSNTIYDTITTSIANDKGKVLFADRIDSVDIRPYLHQPDMDEFLESIDEYVSLQGLHEPLAISDELNFKRERNESVEAIMGS